MWWLGQRHGLTGDVSLTQRREGAFWTLDSHLDALQELVNYSQLQGLTIPKLPIRSLGASSLAQCR